MPKLFVSSKCKNQGAFMIKLKFQTIIYLSFMLIFSGCASTNQSHIYSEIYVSTESELVADIDVNMNEKLTGTATGQYFLGILQISGDNKYADGYGLAVSAEGKAKAAAAYNAISGSKADILVSPQYVLEVNNQIIMKTITATVSGYGGKFKSIKNKQ